MKNPTISIALLCTALLLGAPATICAATADAPKKETVARGKPGIVFDSRQHDFGTIAEDGGAVTCHFTFTNTGSAPLVIVSATASCGCTRPKFPQEPIKPGKTGKITVTYLPMGRPGEFDKTVKVRTNADNGKKVTLRISGIVTPTTKK